MFSAAVCLCRGGGGGADGLFAQQEPEPIRGRPAIWWTAGTARGGTGHLGLTHTETQRVRLRTACGQRHVDSKNSQTTPTTTSTSSIRQSLGAADVQTAHHATFSTPTHQLLGSANTETTPARAPAAPAATRPNVTQGGGGGRNSDNKGDGLASQPRRYRVPGQPLPNRHQVGGVSRSPDGLFAQQEWEPIRGRPAVRGKGAYGGRPGQRVEEGTWAAQKHSEAGDGRPVDRGVWTAKTVKRPRQQPAHPQYANYWAPLTCKRHTMPHPAQSQHANFWASRTRKRHQQEHRPQRPTESSDPTQHAKGRTGDRPGPRKGATTRRNVTQGGSKAGEATRTGNRNGGDRRACNILLHPSPLKFS